MASPIADIDAQIAELLPEWYSDPDRYVKEAYLWDQGDLEGLHGPDKWQSEFLKDLGEEIKRTEEEGGSVRMAVASGNGVGKTALNAWIIQWFLTVRNPAKVRVTANTEAQLLGTTWAELSLWHNRSIHKHWFDWKATSFSRVDNTENAKAIAVNWDEKKPDAFAGVHSKNTLLLMDEASGIPQTIWEAALGYLTTSQAIHLATGNPLRPSGGFYDCFTRNKSRWNTRHIDSRDAAAADTKYMQSIVDDYGEDSDIVRRRVTGQFPRQGARQFISRETVDDAMARKVTLEEVSNRSTVMGVDVARYGDDRTCILLRKGPKVTHIETFEQTNLAWLSDFVVSTLRRHPDIAYCYIDEVGLGAGVLDNVHRYDDRAIGVNVGRRPNNPRIYQDLRVELWDKMKKWLETADLPENEQLARELYSPEYDINASGKTALERKRDMKARGVDSPDIADALAISFFMPEGADLHIYGEDEEFDVRMKEAQRGRSVTTGY